LTDKTHSTFCKEMHNCSADETLTHAFCHPHSCEIFNVNTRESLFKQQSEITTASIFVVSHVNHSVEIQNKITPKVRTKFQH
jgi:hypothetical protein